MPSPESLANAYIGRFAPTPSGLLHFGSLVAALASFLDARAVGGRWLVRMEDLDPPREMPGAQDAILRTLELHGLAWDGPVLRQSERLDAYRAVIDRLLSEGLAYACNCSRKQLEPYPGAYPGLCREQRRDRHDAAIRLRVPDAELAFVDRVQGRYSQHLGREVGDFVIQRRDGHYAYQLAVVLDDALQGVTDVVRGADLLDSTPRQIFLQQLLGLPTPCYLHVPLLVQPDGQKLGKRYRSAALDAAQVVPALLRSLRTLGQQPPASLALARTGEVLDWAIAHWDAGKIPRTATLDEASLG